MRLRSFSLAVAAIAIIAPLNACGGGAGSLPSTGVSDSHNRSVHPQGGKVGGGGGGSTSSELPSQFSVLTTNAQQANVHFESNANANGDLGVNGSGQVQLESGSQIVGAALVQSGTKVHNNGAIIADGVTIDPADLANAVSAAESVSASDSSLAPTISTPTTIDEGQGQTSLISGIPGAANVLAISAVDMAAQSTLTLNAPAGSSFVLNVSGELHVQQGAQILVSGGMSAGDVVINFTGTQGDIHLEQGSSVAGSLLAVERQNIHLEQSSIVGGMIVADGHNVHLEKNSQVDDIAPTMGGSSGGK